MKHKRIYLGIGAIAAVATPIAVVLSCGSHGTKDDTHHKSGTTSGAHAANPTGLKATAAPTAEFLKTVEAEKLIGGLSVKGKALSHFLIVVGKDDKGFDVRTCFDLHGSVADFTNRLVLDAADKGEHDYLVTPGFDASKIKVGDVITEEVNAENPVTSSSSHGKDYPYGLVANADVSFQA